MLNYNDQSIREKQWPFISCHHRSVIPQEIYDFDDLLGKLGAHPTLFIHRETEEATEYDVGVATEGLVTTLLTADDGKEPGAINREIRGMLHQYSMAYQRHLKISNHREKDAFLPVRDAFWNFWEW